MDEQRHCRLKAPTMTLMENMAETENMTDGFAPVRCIAFYFIFPIPFAALLFGLWPRLGTIGIHIPLFSIFSIHIQIHVSAPRTEFKLGHGLASHSQRGISYGVFCRSSARLYDCISGVYIGFVASKGHHFGVRV